MPVISLMAKLASGMPKFIPENSTLEADTVSVKNEQGIQKWTQNRGSLHFCGSRPLYKMFNSLEILPSPHTHTSSHSFIGLQNIGYSSVCYIVGPCCLYFSYIDVCIVNPNLLIYPLSVSFGNHKFNFLCLWVCFCFFFYLILSLFVIFFNF